MLALMENKSRWNGPLLLFWKSSKYLNHSIPYFSWISRSIRSWIQISASVSICTSNFNFESYLRHLVLRYRHRFCGFLRRRRPHGHMKKVEQNRVLTTAHWKISLNIFFRTFFDNGFNANALVLFCSRCRGDTKYYGGLRSRELCQAPILRVPLTPRQALLSHPQCHVFLYGRTD